MSLSTGLWLALLSLPLLAAAQAPIDSIALQAPATQLVVDQEGNLLTLDAETGLLGKYYTSSQYDSLYRAGGRGLQGEGFVQATSLLLVNRSELFVLDAGSDRILLLNTNLRQLREHRFAEKPVYLQPTEPPNYLQPLALAASTTGELFVLNQADGYIYAFDQYGRFALRLELPAARKPHTLAFDADRQLWLLNRGRLMVYDEFGTRLFQAERPPRGAPAAVGVRVQPSGGVVAFSESQVHHYSSQGELLSTFSLASATILDVALQGGRLYILTEKAVLLYALDND